ncbi:DUF4278 domain-containing protein [Pannus brasiliensis CCIBt3594]|uniref:DUF4278 domain-containing protein n=1 Tax=Pannus brasiliensis CCIBt3594 TaxID=1427578 RepID=A0AAW9QPM9_9CHRO
MQLTYRGVTYTRSTEAETPNTVLLVYRGVTYTRTLAPISPVSRAMPATEKTVELIYRGVKYTRPASPFIPYEKPRAINWRYQFSEISA